MDMSSFARRMARENPVMKWYPSRQMTKLESIRQALSSPDQQIDIDAFTANPQKKKIIKQFIDSINRGEDIHDHDGVFQLDFTSREISSLGELWKTCLHMPITNMIQYDDDSKKRIFSTRDDERKWKEIYTSSIASLTSLSLDTIMKFFYGKDATIYYFFHGSNNSSLHSSLLNQFEKKEGRRLHGRGKLGQGFYLTPYMNLGLNYAMIQRQHQQNTRDTYLYMFALESDVAKTLIQGIDFIFLDDQSRIIHDWPTDHRYANYREFVMSSQKAMDSIRLIGIFNILREQATDIGIQRSLSHGKMWGKDSIYRFARPSVTMKNPLMRIMSKLNPISVNRFLHPKRALISMKQQQKQQEQVVSMKQQQQQQSKMAAAVVSDGIFKTMRTTLQDKHYGIDIPYRKIIFGCTIERFLSDLADDASNIRNYIHEFQQCYPNHLIQMTSCRLDKKSYKKKKMILMLIAFTQEQQDNQSVQSFQDKLDTCRDRCCVFISNATKRYTPILITPPMGLESAKEGLIPFVTSSTRQQFNDLWKCVSATIIDVLTQSTPPDHVLGSTDRYMQHYWNELHKRGFYMRIHGKGVRHLHVRLEQHLSYIEDFQHIIEPPDQMEIRCMWGSLFPYFTVNGRNLQSIFMEKKKSIATFNLKSDMMLSTFIRDTIPIDPIKYDLSDLILCITNPEDKFILYPLKEALKTSISLSQLSFNISTLDAHFKLEMTNHTAFRFLTSIKASISMDDETEYYYITPEILKYVESIFLKSAAPHIKQYLRDIRSGKFVKDMFLPPPQSQQLSRTNVPYMEFGLLPKEYMYLMLIYLQDKPNPLP